ncbi:hypothetical protein ACJX0J_021210 [Zea mays]
MTRLIWLILAVKNLRTKVRKRNLGLSEIKIAVANLTSIGLRAVTCALFMGMIIIIIKLLTIKRQKYKIQHTVLLEKHGIPGTANCKFIKNITLNFTKNYVKRIT